MILPDASCADCRDQTHAFEGRVGGFMLKPFRTRYGLPSRSKPTKQFNVEVIARDGEAYTASVPAEDHPSPILLRHFDKAGALIGLPPEWDTFGMIPQRMWVWPPTVGEETRELAEDREIQHATRLAAFDELAWGRMLAKIGYCYGVAEHGLDTFQPLGLPLILGKTDVVSYVVGGSLDDPPPAPEGILHRLSLDFTTTIHGIFIVASIQLFANLGAPLYHAVVSKLQGEEHMRTLLENRPKT
jgi:hypothetical protein